MKKGFDASGRLGSNVSVYEMADGADTTGLTTSYAEDRAAAIASREKLEADRALDQGSAQTLESDWRDQTVLELEDLPDAVEPDA